TFVAQGRVGQAFSLDGVDDYVRLNYSASLLPGAGSFSLGAWVKTTLTSHSQVVFAMYECGGLCPSGVANSLYELALSNGTGVPSWSLRDSTGNNVQTISGTSTVADGNWHLLMAGRDISALTTYLYVDGTLVSSSPLSSEADGTIKDDDGEPDPETIGA